MTAKEFKRVVWYPGKKIEYKGSIREELDNYLLNEIRKHILKHWGENRNLKRKRLKTRLND